MESITKVFFDPLATTKAQIRAILEELPAGSAHPFSPEDLLLYHTAPGLEEIDISAYDETHFFKAVDLGALGHTLQTRMAKFDTQLQIFNDEYTVEQAPMGSAFKVPIEAGKIAILAVSERYPTYYDLCVADAGGNTICYSTPATFSGMMHSGDINMDQDLLHHIKVSEELPTGTEFAIFVSGYSMTKLTRFQERNPVVMIANHAKKALYIVPVPLDTASIGHATICTPVVFKREGDLLICCILPTPTTDLDKCCGGASLQSTSFKEAVERADWTISPALIAPISSLPTVTNTDLKSTSEQLSSIFAKNNAVFITQTTLLPSNLDETTQIIRYGTGLEFLSGVEKPENTPSAVVLPCIFGSRLEGPLILATGKSPENVPFHDEQSLRSCYERFKSVVVYVDERMTDNARNLATQWRMNAVFIIQLSLEAPQQESEVSTLLNLVNINAVTALAGPQSLVLVQISEKYYFYRGIANRAYLNTSKIAFGSDVTEIVQRTGLNALLERRVTRLVNLREAANTVLLPKSGQVARPEDLKDLFEKVALADFGSLEDDISAIIPQLQVLMSQSDLVDISRSLIAVLSAKVGYGLKPIRSEYIKFMTKEFKMNDAESVKKKKALLSHLRKASREVQKSLESIISHLSNMMSSQTTSKRTHDLQRLERQASIQNNIEAVKSMTFESLGALLETKAADIGVLLLNIETEPFKNLLGNLKHDHLDADSCCDLDSRVLFLEGFDAGIIIEQSQSNHDGPLKHQLGASQPILALPYLSQERGNGSMLAWVCWDEFVNLESPFKVRWMERCNEPHIAAFRILMRDTLSRAVVSREHNMQPGNPEIGQLMSALLMAAMSKLAALRTTAPTRTVTAEDTITKLMRGLFGNLLTAAGSGVRPMSMVWQLFGLEPKLEVPKTAVDWSWYETVVRLYPYSGWPQTQFNLNLEKLLEKALNAVITKNEITENLKASRAEWMIKCCKLRNIQLEHSRTILTIFIRMMNSDADRKIIATRLLAALPSHLAKQSKSYPKMIEYIEYVASTGLRRESDDIIVVAVYLKRSAVFKTLKLAAAEACKCGKDTEVKKLCLELMDKFNEIADKWKLPCEKLVMQNAKAYKALIESLASEPDEESEDIKKQRKKLMDQIVGDAEKLRVPWQVGKPGEFGDDIEPLDDVFLDEIMTGKKATASTLQTPVGSEMEKVTKPQGMEQFASVVRPEFITDVDTVVTPNDVCKIMNVPMSAMVVFALILNPAFNFEKDLGTNFRLTVFDLLADRKDRSKQQPIRTLFIMKKGQKNLEGGTGTDSQKVSGS